MRVQTPCLTRYTYSARFQFFKWQHVLTTEVFIVNGLCFPWAHTCVSESLEEGEPRDLPTSALPDISSQGSGSDQILSGNLHGPGLIHAQYARKPGRSIPDINVEPPTDAHALEMQSNQGYVNICLLRMSWLTEVFSSSRDGSPFMQGYPQVISRSGTQSRTFSVSPTSNVANWGSPASSESAFSNHVYACELI